MKLLPHTDAAWELHCSALPQPLDRPEYLVLVGESLEEPVLGICVYKVVKLCFACLEVRYVTEPDKIFKAYTVALSAIVKIAELSNCSVMFSAALPSQEQILKAHGFIESPTKLFVPGIKVDEPLPPETTKEEIPQDQLKKSKARKKKPSARRK